MPRSCPAAACGWRRAPSTARSTGFASEGLVSETGRERVEGRERRYYALTDQGHAVLAEEAERMAAASRAVITRLDLARGTA